MIRGRIGVAVLVYCLIISNSAFSAECDDRSAKQAAMDASEGLLGGESFRMPVVLKRHHPSKRKEVATYFQRRGLYYTLFWLVDNSCRASFIKRTQGKY